MAGPPFDKLRTGLAQATRPLCFEAAGEVDRALAGYVGQLGWTRFERLLEAAVLAADPVVAAERSERARTDRGVWATDAQHGQKTIVARTDSSTATWFMAAVDRIAAALAAEGDDDSVDLRRSKALGWLSQPAGALDLLMRHTDEVDQGNDPEPEPEEAPASEPRPSAGDQVPDDIDPEQAAHGLRLTAPARFDAAKARPKVVLHFHLSDTTLRSSDGSCSGVGMVRPEHGGPITADQLRDFLTGTGCQINIQPVIDPADIAPIDGYEISHRMRRAVRYRDLADTSPYATSTSMSMDLDHTVPYRAGGPPGQTGPENLGPLSRPPHRGKTFHRWFVRQPDPGTHLWRSRFGRVYLVTNQGTLPLGNTEYSHALWDLAAPAVS